MKTLIAIVVMMLAAIGLGADAVDRLDPSTPRSLSALRIPAGKIQIDGSLDDPAWKETLFQSDFFQRDPIEGDPATERTEFAVLYDDEYLYVAVMAYDSDPNEIRSILSRRDERTPSDWVYVSFDSYGDFRTAFEFWLNPQGVKRDVRRFNDTDMDENWDAIWEGKAVITDNGWSAEYRIPFRELRFSDSQNQDWGLQVYRHISRKNEDDYWRFWAKEEDGYVRHFGRLTALSDIPKQRRIYLSPYSTGSYTSAKALETPVHTNSYDFGKNIGVDMKIGVTNNFTLDLTVNPDFGQVEADPAELNLTAFESFYPEKRPFFLEGSNIFNYALGFGDGGMGSTTLFYPRRIGRSPQSYPDYEEAYINSPRSTAILAAGKLSGKTADGWSVGIMNAVAAEEVATINFTDGRAAESEVVEPMTNYFVGRIQKDFNKGNTTVGGILTHIARDIGGDSFFGLASDGNPHLDGLRSGAITGGVDFRHKFADGNYEIEGSISATNVTGSAEAIENTQMSSVRYFQRPDAKHLGVDPTRTSLSGFASKLIFSKVRGKHVRGAAGYWATSPGFEPNDLGFMRSVDNHGGFVWAQYRENDPGKYIRSYSVNLNAWTGFTFSGFDERAVLGGNINGNLTFMNYWRMNAGRNINLPSLNLNALWGGPAMQGLMMKDLWWNINSDSRKAFSFGLNGWGGGDPDGIEKWSGLSPSMTWRPNNFFSLRMSTGYNTRHDEWTTWGGYGPLEDQQSATGETRYIMAEINSTTLSTTLRFDLTLSPTLSIQFYGSPFVTAGKYTNDKMVLEDMTRAEQFDDRFHIFTDAETSYDPVANEHYYDSDGDGITNFTVGNRDYNYKQFNSNLVVRWEYQTGSAIYLVWARNMSKGVEMGDFNLLKDLETLFNLDAENVLMLKASYLLNI